MVIFTIKMNANNYQKTQIYVKFQIPKSSYYADVNSFARIKVSIEDIRVEIPCSIYFVPNNYIPT